MIDYSQSLFPSQELLDSVGNQQTDLEEKLALLEEETTITL